MRDIDHHGVIRQFKKRLSCYVSVIIKEDQAHLPSYDDQGFILIRIQMPVRLNIRAGFHRIEKAVADIFIRKMKIIILA